MELLAAAVSSPWVYLALFAVAVLDAFFPVVPSETLVITAGVFAASGTPELALVVAVAAVGAFVGDHISYQIGQRAGQAVLRRVRPGGRRERLFAWASAALARRGGLLLVVARYIPGGRTATTMTMGTVRYPRAPFAAFDAAATISWAGYSALIGYLGGATFGENKLMGLLLGLGLAAAVTAVVEALRHFTRRPARAGAPGVRAPGGRGSTRPEPSRNI